MNVSCTGRFFEINLCKFNSIQGNLFDKMGGFELKKILYLMLILILVQSLVACGNEKTTDSEQNTDIKFTLPSEDKDEETEIVFVPMNFGYITMSVLVYSTM